MRHDHSDCRPIAWRSDKASDTSKSAVDPAIGALEQRVSELEIALLGAEAAAKEAIAAARVEARREAEAGFKRDEAQRLAVLEATLQTVRDDARARLDQVEALALVLCDTALEETLGEPKDMRDLVALAIRRQMATLRRETVLRICVSPSDFTELETLQDLQTLVGGVSVILDAALDRGACRLELRLGDIEISLPKYWRALQSKLRELAQAEAAL